MISLAFRYSADWDCGTEIDMRGDMNEPCQHEETKKSANTINISKKLQQLINHLITTDSSNHLPYKQSQAAHH